MEMDVNLLLNSFLILDWVLIVTSASALLSAVAMRHGRHHDALVRVRLSR